MSNQRFWHRLRGLFFCLVMTALAMSGWAQTGGSAGSLLYFPRFLSVAEQTSGIAIFNPSLKEAVVTLTLADSAGNTVGTPATLRVPAQGQSVRTAEQIFGSLNAPDASLKLSSTTPGLLACYQTFDLDGSYMDGAGPAESSLNLLFPVTPGAREGSSEIDLFNANSRSTGVELKLWDLDGKVLAKVNRQVSAGGTFYDIPESLFPDGTDFSRASHITATAKPLNVFGEAQPLFGTSLFFGFSSFGRGGAFVDIAALNALTLAQVPTNGAFPFFRTGGKYAATISAVNAEPAAVDVSFTAIGTDGLTLGTRTVTLQANGGYRDNLQGVIPSLAVGEKQGWILVSATGRVAVSLIYGRSDAEAITAAPMQEAPRYDFVLPQMVQGFGYWTEVALANPAGSTAIADLFLVDPTGATVAAEQIKLKASEQMSEPLNRLFPEVSSQNGGYLFVRSSEALFGSASVWSDSGATLTDIPQGPVPSSYAPQTLKSFAVTGTVTLNGRPAAGFPVVLSGPASKVATTDSRGIFAFTKLPSGRYSMMVDQFGFKFVPDQVFFELTTTSKRQDFAGVTGENTILVQPGSAKVGGPDLKAAIFGHGFDSGSKGYVGAVQLKTSFVDASELQVVIPEFLLANPAQFDIFVETGSGPSRSVSKGFSFVAYQDKPFLNSIATSGDLVEGTPGTTITLRGTGFLQGARVWVNGKSDDITTTLVSDRQVVAYLPAAYLAEGGIFPVTVENPYPAGTESNVQLLTVLRPAPAIEEIFPKSVPVRLEDGAGSLNLDVLGSGFRRGAVVKFDGTPLLTTYCENDAYCLSVHLYAKVPAGLLRSAGFAKIVVENPAPSLAASEAAFLRMEGLQPTVITVLPGSATALDTPFSFTMPVLVTGTNFGPDTSVRVYQEGVEEIPEFSGSGVVLLSSHQLHTNIVVSYPDALGQWYVEVANSQPGGGISEPVSFFIDEGAFVENPFLLSMTPQVVAAGGPALTLVVNGTNFQSGAEIRFNTTTLVTTVVSSRQARAEVPASLIKNAGKFPISLTNPDNGGTSNRLFLEVR